MSCQESFFPFSFFFSHVCLCVCLRVCAFACECFRRRWVGEISDSLIKDVSKTLIKIEYPCKAPCNLQVFHLEQLSHCAAFVCERLRVCVCTSARSRVCVSVCGFGLSSLHANSYPPLSLLFLHFHVCRCLCPKNLPFALLSQRPNQTKTEFPVAR